MSTAGELVSLAAWLDPMDPNDRNLLALYDSHLQARGMAQTTRYERGRLITQLFSQTGKTTATVALADVEDYFAARNSEQIGRTGKPLSARTINSNLSTIADFFRWAIPRGHATRDPAAEIPRAKQPRTMSKRMPDEHVIMIFEQARHVMRLWVSLLTFAGMRVSDLAALRRENIHDGWARVEDDTKGGTHRDIPLRAEIIDLIDSLPLPESGYLFVDEQGERLGSKRIGRRLGNFFADLGIEHHRSHALRTWWCSEFLRVTQDLRAAQLIMGHVSPTTTALYSHIQPDHLRSQVERMPDVSDLSERRHNRQAATEPFQDSRITYG